MTKAGFELGRRLFYDPIFSRDSTIACGDCHISYSAFSHPDHGVSHGIDGLLGIRNAPASSKYGLANILFLGWRRTKSRSRSTQRYPKSSRNGRIACKCPAQTEPPSAISGTFSGGFPGQDTISGATMLKAFSQFMAMLISSNSRYDKYVRNESGGTLSPTN